MSEFEAGEQTEGGEAEASPPEDEVVADKPPLPEGDLEHYEGQWVAVRGGAVVAHAAEYETLMADPAVEPGDDVFPIGEPPSGFYFVEGGGGP